MRTIRLVLMGGALALGGIACAGRYDVVTLVAPQARFATLRTFRVLPAPQPRVPREPRGAYDPMVNNSITNRALRETVAAAFQRRGYEVSEVAPDYVVAVYASAQDKLDIDMWDYGYPPCWPGAWPGVDCVSVNQYTEGSVVIDVIEQRTHELLWRGHGTATMTEDPSHDIEELKRLAKAVVKAFPKASKRMLAVAR